MDVTEDEVVINVTKMFRVHRVLLLIDVVRERNSPTGAFEAESH